MKIAFIAYELKSLHSGLTVSFIEYCQALKKLGNEIIVFGLFADENIKETLNKMGIQIHLASAKRPVFYNLRMITYSKSLAKKLGKIIHSSDLADAYIVYADEAIRLIEFANSKIWVYIFQGDWSLLYLNKSFVRMHKVISRIMSLSFSHSIRKHGSWIEHYKIIASNSDFAGSLGSFIYELPITRTVYPPLQARLEKLLPMSAMDKKAYFVVILRNEFDGGFHLISKIAHIFNIKVIGGGSVKGCENLGFLPPDVFDSTVKFALATLAPVNNEYFGRGIIESMALGTPVIAFNNSGAREILSGFNCGWLATDESDFVNIMTNISKNRYSDDIIVNCILRSKRFTSEIIANEIIGMLNVTSAVFQ